MILRYSLQTALKGLTANIARSALTVLGIVIGIAAIIVVMSLGDGVQQVILDQLQGLGSKTIAVIPGREPKGPSDAAQILSDSLTLRDLQFLQRKDYVPDALHVVPLVFGAGSASYERETYSVTLFGAAPSMGSILSLVPSQGVFLSEEDVKARSDVAVLGYTVAEELFGTPDAVGKRIKVKDRSLRVIGVLPEKGQVSFFNFDEAVIMPYTTAQQYVLGIRYFHRFLVEARSEASLPTTVADIERTLRETHGITNLDKDDFHVHTQVDIANTVGTVTSIITLFLVAVAGISLVVGGVGIMNIMLVSVTERNREIGLRKALGATNDDILMQFLLEAIMLTGVGGMVGIALGILISFTAAFIIGNVVSLGLTFRFPWLATFIALGVSSAIGLVFGLYPARKAAAKSPIEALRYE